MKRKTITIEALLTERRQIAHIWSVEDVQQVRPDLDDDQAWEVLQCVDHDKNAEFGITWLTLEMAAEHLFGDAHEADEAEEGSMSTIRERSLRCQLALNSYCRDDPVTNLIDVLADAMAWCRCTGTDFEQAFDIADRLFQLATIEETGVFP